MIGVPGTPPWSHSACELVARRRCASVSSTVVAPAMLLPSTRLWNRSYSAVDSLVTISVSYCPVTRASEPQMPTSALV